MREANTSRLLELAAKRRAEAEAKEAEKRKARPSGQKAPKLEKIEDIPEELLDALDEVDDDSAREAAEDEYMISIAKSLDIITAYEMFANKGKVDGEPDSAGNIFVRCPRPDHVDNRPSAQVLPPIKWVCHGCGADVASGDPISLVAATQRLDYHDKRDFIETVKIICSALGHEFITDSSGREHIVLPVRDDEEDDPAPEVEVHGDGEGLDDLFDPEEALAKGELTRPKPEPLPAELEFMLDTMDEVDSGTKNADKIQEKLRARKAAQAPKIPAKKASKPLENSSKTPEKPSATAKNAPKRPKGMPKFNLNGALAEDTPKIAPSAEDFEPDEPKGDEKTTTGDDSGSASLPDPDVIDYPSVNWREIIPQGTFIHDYMEFASRDDVIEEFHFWNAVMAVSLACRRDIMLEDDPPVWANLYVCSVAKTGSKKSKANGLFRRVLDSCGPLKVSDPESSEGIRIIPKPNSGEVLVDHFVGERKLPIPPGAKEAPPPIKFPIAGLLQISELSGILRAAARKENTLETFLIQMYDCEEQVTSSARSTGTTTAIMPFLCLSAGVQPSLIKTLVSKDMSESGFANRFIWAYGPPKPRIGLGDPNAQLEAVSHLGLKLAEVRRNAESAGEFKAAWGARQLSWDPAARELWLDFFRGVDLAWQKMKDSDPASRVELILKKLILIFTINMGKTSVPPEAVEQAIGMWEYLTATYRLVGSNMTASARREVENDVIAVIRKHQQENKGQGPSASELSRKLRGMDLDDLNKILQSLVRLGMVTEREREPGQRGRPTKRYILN